MGTLTPGATYIYERSEGIIYAREFGKTERHVVGYESGSDYDPLSKGPNKRMSVSYTHLTLPTKRIV